MGTKSFPITDRLFKINQEDVYSDLIEINAGIPQGIPV